MKQVSIAVLFAVYLVSCRKGAPDVPVTSLKLKLDFNVSGSPLLFDTLKYINSSKQTYSVSRLEFFISGIVLHASSGDFVSDQVFYVDARYSVGAELVLENLPARMYSGISCLIGLDAAHNVTGALFPNKNNNEMFWPVPMGGGYHFMKLEGRVKSADSSLGYAMHLGQNTSLVHSVLSGTINIKSGETHQSVIAMDINSWFDTPYDYDFFIDGRYTMSFPFLMMKLRDNGTDVLSFKQP